MPSRANDAHLLATGDFLAPTFGEAPTRRAYMLHSVSSGGASADLSFGFQPPADTYRSDQLPHSSAEETAGILATPDLVQAIADGTAEIRRGEGLGPDELDELLARRRER